MNIKKPIQYHMMSSKNRSIYLSEGCLQLIERNKCQWLFELILTYQSNPILKDLDCQVWKMIKQHGRKFRLTCSTRADEVLVNKQVNAADFSPDGVEILYKNQIAMLPNELCEFSHIAI